MRRFPLCHLALLFLLVPNFASAIELKWISGASYLNFTEARRCTLVLQADPAEGGLPSQWRLRWLADSAAIHFVPVNGEYACASDTAWASSVREPLFPADSSANLSTARFCSSARARASVACYILDLEGGGQGTFKVVAVDPTDPDSSRAIESNEVTYNAGVIGSFVPSIVRAESRRQGRQLEVTAVGTGLAHARSLRVTAPDYLWSVPLQIIERSDSRLRAVADVPVALPQAIVEAGHFEDAASLAPLPADQIVAMAGMSQDTLLYVDPDYPAITPKDFAFFYNAVPTSDPLQPWKGLLHLFYIRRVSSTEDSIIAHAWTEPVWQEGSSPNPWRVNLHAFRPSGQGWDAMKVWAPSIRQIGNLYYMFHTGVDEDGDQRIGYATTSLLDTTNTVWTRRPDPVYTAENTTWADPVGSILPGQQQFRDPWVMPDPDSAGRFLLFNIGEDLNLLEEQTIPMGYTVIGLARNEPGTLDSWRDLGAYGATDHNHTLVTRVESPLVVRDFSGTGAWRIYFANGPWTLPGHNSTYLVTSVPGTAVGDTTISKWEQSGTLYDYLGGDSNVVYWQSMEHLQLGNVHLFAAFNGTGIGITRAYWNGNDFVIGYPDLTAVDDPSAQDGIRFHIAGFSLGAPITFVLDSPSRFTPELVLYDLAGRRVQTLTKGREVVGRQEVVWDYRDGHGRVVPAGMYFARLTGVGEPRVIRVPVAH